MNPPAYTIKPEPQHEGQQHEMTFLQTSSNSEHHTEENSNQPTLRRTPPPRPPPLTDQRGAFYVSSTQEQINHTDNNVPNSLHTSQLPPPYERHQQGTDFDTSSTHPAESKQNLALHPTTSPPLYDPPHSTNYPSLTQQQIHQTDRNGNMSLYGVQSPHLPNGTDYPSPTPSQQHLHHTVLIAEPATQYGPASQSVECPHCRLQVITRVKVEPSERTHLYALILCITVFPFSWLPYFINSCQNKTHSCPNCGKYLGTSMHY